MDGYTPFAASKGFSTHEIRCVMSFIHRGQVAMNLRCQRGMTTIPMLHEVRPGSALENPCFARMITVAMICGVRRGARVGWWGTTRQKSARPQIGEPPVCVRTGGSGRSNSLWELGLPIVLMSTSSHNVSLKTVVLPLDHLCSQSTYPVVRYM
jgi:hypothetical protein